ncbi:MAG: hypothetical protein FWE84_04620 [Firmicutes bacterium]|nr:hypothetical protein [Bacillota bacterium]
MDERNDNDIFFDITANSSAAAMLDHAAQSHLFCSKDTDALLLLVKVLIKSENGGRENSADVVYFSEDKILTADVERITTTALVTPLELGFRYYVLKNGQTMNDSAANKLLKTLEEPPPKIKIIILADEPYSVLPTIRSRCRVLALPPYSTEILDNAAEKVFDGRSSAALNRIKSLALGSITRLKRAAAGEYDQIESAVFEVLTGMRKSADVARYSYLLSKFKGDLDEVVNFFELVFGDVLRITNGHTPVLAYQQTELAQIAEFYRPETIIRFKPLLNRARSRLKFSGNAASIVDEFLFSLLEVRQKYQ